MNSFEKNYYVWAKERVDAELDSNFALIRSFQTSVGNRFLGTLLTLPQSEMQSTWKSLLKRFHTAGAVALGEPMSSTDHMATKEYDALCALSFAVVEPGFEPKAPFRKHQLQALACEVIESRLKTRAETLGGKLVRFVSSHRNCMVHTFLDAGSRNYQLCYWHDVLASNGSLIGERLSFLECLGIGSQTFWDHSVSDAEQSITNSLVDAVELFMRFCDSQWVD